MSQHTQGPWIISIDSRYPSEPCVDAVIDGVVWHIALCHNAAGPEDDSADANARLIAAAPDLLASLRDALPVLRADMERQSMEQSGKPEIESVTYRRARVRYENAVAVLAKVEEQPKRRRTDRS
jgi:hypothetical protein